MGNIPLIDIEPFRLGSAADRKAVAKLGDDCYRKAGDKGSTVCGDDPKNPLKCLNPKSFHKIDKPMMGKSKLGKCLPLNKMVKRSSVAGDFVNDYVLGGGDFNLSQMIENADEERNNDEIQHK